MNSEEEVKAYLARFFKAIHDMKQINHIYQLGIRHEITEIATKTIASVRRRRFLTAQDYNILGHVENAVYWYVYQATTSKWRKWLDHYDKETLENAYRNMRNYYREVHGIS